MFNLSATPIDPTTILLLELTGLIRRYAGRTARQPSKRPSLASLRHAPSKTPEKCSLLLNARLLCGTSRWSHGNRYSLRDDLLPAGKANRYPSDTTRL